MNAMQGSPEDQLGKTTKQSMATRLLQLADQLRSELQEGQPEDQPGETTKQSKATRLWQIADQLRSELQEGPLKDQSGEMNKQSKTMRLQQLADQLRLELQEGPPEDQPGETTKQHTLHRDVEAEAKRLRQLADQLRSELLEVDQFVNAFFGEVARSVDRQSADWSIDVISNYVHINLDKVPLHMNDIVRIDLKYFVALDHDFQDVILLQHSQVDYLYLMVGNLNKGELTQEVFESEDSYPIMYYDNPLQPGITPKWSDQNVLGGKSATKKELPRRELNFVEFQRRQKHALAMLENASTDPMAELADKYHAKMLAQQQAARVIDAKRCVAVPGQDACEDDAELDHNTFAQ